jgi:hypothetical protein
MPAWPATLPQFVQESGYSESLPDNVVESGVDSGPPKVRRRFTTQWRPIQATIWCTPDQVTAFETFFLTDTAGGVTAFTWVNPRTQSAKTFRFRRPSPQYRPFGGGNVAISFALWQLD